MIKTILLPNEKAAFIQKHVTEFGCELVEIAVAGNDSAKVTVRGETENVKRLFEQIGE